VGLVLRLDQLACDANALTVAAYASLQHAVHVQRRGDLSNAFFVALYWTAKVRAITPSRLGLSCPSYEMVFLF